MIKIVLVDNDVLDLMQLKQLLKVPRDCVVKDFIYPKEALSYMEKHGADILITDMKMPHMDGISLIRNARKAAPDLHTIVISSYKDFEYVKESFKEGSLDYILKHTLSEEVLKAAFDQAVSKMEERRLKERSPEVLAQSRQLMLEKLIRQLLLREISPESFEEQRKEYKIGTALNEIVMLVCEMDDYRSHTVDFTQADKRIFLDSVMETAKKMGETFDSTELIYMSGGEFVMLLPFGDIRSRAGMQMETVDFIRRMKSTMSRMFNLNLSIAVGEPVPAGKLPEQYDRCLQYLRRKFFEGKGKVYHRLELPEAEEASVQMIGGAGERPYEELIQELKEGSIRVELLYKLFSYYQEKYYPREMIELQMAEVLQRLWTLSEERHLTLPEEYRFHTFYGQLGSLETMEDIKECMEKLFNCVSEKIKDEKEGRYSDYNKYTVAAIEYMQKNYRLPLSLQEVADYLGVNHTYLSKIFKEDTGDNFTSFLTNYRIKKAKELIDTKQYKIKDIYKLVGFSSYNYFFTVFKKRVGVSPLEYENKKNGVKTKKVEP